MTGNTEQLLAAAAGALDEDRVLYLVKRSLVGGESPLSLLNQLREGLDRAIKRYGRGEYFLADLLMAAEIFRQALGVLTDLAEAAPDPALPPLVFGTVEGDIHQIGKNLTVAFLRFSGLRVLDLGVNVPAERFVEEVRASRAPVLCLSGLLTTCVAGMERTVAALEQAGLRSSTAVVIGGQVSESIRRRVGADYYSGDCRQAVELCRALVSGGVPVRAGRSAPRGRRRAV
jgi:methanogenic corrinoid protein MtbC1